MTELCMVVAASANDVIGRGNDLPWHVPDDLRRFRTITSGGCVVVGRLTHESIVGRLGRPLPGRHTFVASRQVGERVERDGVHWSPDVLDAVAWARDRASLDHHDAVFVIGGADVYAQLLPQTDRVMLTRIEREIGDGDAFLPAGWLDGFVRSEREDTTAPDGTPVAFETYVRAR